jgi:hypothetical protein
MGYYVSQTGELKIIDDATYASWVASGNPKADAYKRIPDPPAPNAYWDGKEWVIPPPYVPQSVSRFQAKAALLNAGLLDQVEAIVADPATSAMTKLAWADAVEFDRNSPTIIELSHELGLTDSEIDDLFIAAAQISI